MSKEQKPNVEEQLEDPEFIRLVAQEDLILDVTETLCWLMEKEEVPKQELATRLGKSEGFVSLLLLGGRQLTLRTVADVLHALGYAATFSVRHKGG